MGICLIVNASDGGQLLTPSYGFKHLILWCMKAPVMIQDPRLQKSLQVDAPGSLQLEGKGPPFLPVASSQIKLLASVARVSDLNDFYVCRT